jgi:hypothetical protein
MSKCPCRRVLRMADSLYLELVAIDMLHVSAGSHGIAVLSITIISFIESF